MKQFSKEERSWIMYDWANSAFATIMLAAVFPVFFVGMAGGEDTLGSMWWARGTALARLVLGISAPIIGALIAYKGFKKRLFVSFLAFGVLFHLFVAAQSSWPMLLIGYIFANMLWSAGNIIYDSYLPDVTSKDRMDKVSAWGFAMGYIGGSTIPFLISIFLILFGTADWFPMYIDNTLAVRISVVMTAVWWAIFSVPMIRNVHHKYPVDVPQNGMISGAFKTIWATAKKITKNKGMFLFIVAYFFYIDGVGTVITMATAYGAELGLGDTGLIGALFVTQIVAMPFSILFGKLADRFNSINLIIAAICVYLLICVTGFVMGFGLEENWFGYGVGMVMFWALAFMVGTVQGGIQATSRAVYGRLVPPENSGEYFGFFEIFGRFAAILGPFLYATVLAITGRPSVSILSIIFIFLIGLTILLVGKKHLNLRPAKESAE
ncbi:MAG: MFS transporter [Defluviitaleaceae bacterium]|nr:MFS transporter [Defluviitaleaceae bacterium]